MGAPHSGGAATPLVAALPSGHEPADRSGESALSRRLAIPPDRALQAVVGATAGLALAVVLGSLWAIAAGRVPPIDVLNLLGVLVLVISAGRLMPHLRIGSSRHVQSLTDAVIMLGLVVLPGPWLALTVGTGTLIAKSMARLPARRVVFTAAKDVVTVSIAWGVAQALGLEVPFTVSGGTLGRLALVALAAIAADELVTVPVIALGNGGRIRQVWARHAGIRLTAAVIRMAIAITAGYLLHKDPRFAIAVPLVTVALHLLYANRLQQRAEKGTWLRLARLVDALGGADPETVRVAAVRGTAELFSADEVDLLVRMPDGSERLLRGDSRTMTYAGPAENAPPRPGSVIVAPLDSHESQGELRLRFRDPATFSEREQYTLWALASALGTAMRKAHAMAAAARMADDRQHAATHDTLTGLANRTYLLAHAPVAPPGSFGTLAAISGSEEATAIDEVSGDCSMGESAFDVAASHDEPRIALAVLDLAGFKQINEVLGRRGGDQVLVAVARRLVGESRPGELVARLADDEFAILFTPDGPADNPIGAVAAVRRFLRAIGQPLVIYKVRLDITAVAGIALGEVGFGVGELLRRADVAVNQAKRDGQAIALYDPTNDPTDVHRLALGAELTHAVARREFTIAFQPIVDLETGMIRSAEALARWTHPQLGQLGPQRFLAAIERSGLLPAFTEHILDQALAGAVLWRAAGFDFPVAVNISPRSLLDQGLPGQISAALARHELPPASLIVELTETLTVSELEVVDDVLRKLHALGVMIALDDFGTGFSSFATVARVPIHELKIDRAFVSRLSDPTEAAIVRSTIELGRDLGHVVVAEGVEDYEQRERLWALGCTAGQGHLFSWPLSAEHLIARLRRGDGGVPGRLAAPIHSGEVIRLPLPRRPTDGSRLRDEIN